MPIILIPARGRKPAENIHAVFRRSIILIPARGRKRDRVGAPTSPLDYTHPRKGTETGLVMDELPDEVIILIPARGRKLLPKF